MNKIILFTTLLFTLLSYSQDPYIIPEGSQNEVRKDLGGRIMDSLLILPVRNHDALYPDAPLTGRIQFNRKDSVVEYHNGKVWIRPNPNYTYKFQYPADFTFRPFGIYAINGDFFPDKSNKDLVSEKISKMMPYYLDYVNGSNSNNGKTENTAFKTLSYALSQGARLIYLRGGDVIQNDGWGSINATSYNQDIFIITKGNEPAYVLNNLAGLSFTLESGSTYQTDISTNTIPNVVDMNFVDKYGFPLTLKRKTSLVQVNSEPNSFFVTGTTLYIHLNNGRVPDSNVFPLKTSTNNYISSNTSFYFYGENIMFMGGNASFNVRSVNSVGGTGVYGLLNNCVFAYANQNGLEGAVNPGIVWSENCIAYNNGRDGFNYSQGTGYTTLRAIEVNCIGFENGVNTTDMGSANNGSSIHNKGTVIRVNCKYFRNVGPNVADVSGALSLNIGVECFESLGFDDSGSGGLGKNWADWGDFGVGTISTEAGTKMWLYGCTSQDERRSYFTPEFLADDVTPDTSEMFIYQSINTSPYSGTITLEEFISGNSTVFNFPSLTGGYEEAAIGNQNLQNVLDKGSIANINTSVIIGKSVGFSDPSLIKVGAGTTTDLYNTLGASEEISGTGNYNAINGEARGTALADNTGRVRGGKFVSLVNPNGFSYNNTGGGSMGVEGAARVVGSGTVHVATGVYARVLADVSGANITNAVALNAPQPFATTGASIVNAMGVHITEQNVTNVTNSFNMVVGNPGGGGTIAPIGVTGHYSIYNLSNYYNYFKQRLGLGTDTPSEMLDVVGNIKATGNISTSMAPTAGDNLANKTYVDGKVTQTITNGVTLTAPSEDATFDALALKANLSGVNTFTGTQTFSVPFAITGGVSGDLLTGTGASTNGNNFVRSRQISGTPSSTAQVGTGTTFNNAALQLQAQVNLKAPTDNTVLTGTTTAAQYKLSALNTAPSSASDTGVTGEIRITTDYIYVCIATNTWVRAALNSW